MNGLARHKVNTGLIRDNWDDLLRVAGSLKQGTISASRSALPAAERASFHAGAGARRAGSINKTLYLLSYMDDQAIDDRSGSAEPPRGASWPGTRDLSREAGRNAATVSGRSGGPTGRVGLVVNVIVLWNTLYTEAALNRLRSRGGDVKPDDVARLSPLEYQHINFLGQNSFALTESITG